MKKIISFLIMFIFFIFLLSINTYATDEEMLEEQKEEFGIGDFLDSAKEYTGEFFEDVDINTILENAIKGEIDNSTILKKILNIFGSEVIGTLKIIGSILVIVVIHSVLKAIGEGLENKEITTLIYYVQYILIVTIVITNFAEIVNLVKESVSNLVGFMNVLVPLLMTLVFSTGSISTSSIIEPIILFAINFVGNIIQTLIIPLILIMASLVIISKISDRVQIDKISKFFKSGIVWFLGIVLTIFVGIVSLEGTMSSSIDGITAKTSKAIVSSAIPVVGKILGDAVDSFLGGAVIIKNAVRFTRSHNYYRNCSNASNQTFYNNNCI